MLVCEDDDLVELQVVEQVDQLHDLLLLVQLHKILLQSMQIQLGIVVDVKLKGTQLPSHRDWNTRTYPAIDQGQGPKP